MKKTLLACLILSAPAFADSPAHHPLENPNLPLFGESRDAIVTDLDISQIQGEAFTKQYAQKMIKAKGKTAILAQVEKELTEIRNTVADFDAFRTKAAAQLPVLKKFDAQMYDYVVAMAEGLDMNVADFWVSLYMDGAWVEANLALRPVLWNNQDELMASVLEQSQRRGGCTTMAWTNGIVGGNMDFSSLFLGQQKLVYSDDLIFEGNYYGAFRGMGKHIGLIINTLVLDSEGDGAQGLPHPVIIASVTRRATSVDHAIELLDQVQPESPMNYTIGDDQGNAIAYNMISGSDRVVHAEHGFVVHTNHRLDTREKLLAAWDGDYVGANMVMNSLARYDVAEILMQIVPEGERNVTSMQGILRTQPIASRAASGFDFGTTNSYVADLNEGCWYMTPDRPDLVDYTKVCFD